MTALAAIRAAEGAALLLTPHAVLRGVGCERPGERTCRVARVLGTRELVQVLLTADRERRSPAAWLGVAVDATHCATMLAVAAWRPGYRRPAAASALVAGSFAMAGAWTAR